MTRVVADEGGVVSIRDSTSSSRSGVALRGGQEQAGDDEGVSVDVVEGWDGVGDGGVAVERGSSGRVMTIGWSEPGAEASPMGTSGMSSEPGVSTTEGTMAGGDREVVEGGAGVVGGAAPFDAWRADWSTKKREVKKKKDRYAPQRWPGLPAVPDWLGRLQGMPPTPEGARACGRCW